MNSLFSLKQFKGRSEPGSGAGRFFRVIVRPEGKYRFTNWRYQDLGWGHVERLLGKKQRGNWKTQAWLINKHDAHVSGGLLFPDSTEAEEAFNHFYTYPKHLRADIFVARELF